MISFHDIVYTRAYPQRLIRHGLFWLGQFCFWAFLNASIFGNISTRLFLWNDIRLHSFFIPDICYTYFVTYVLSERLLKQKKYTRFFAGLLVATVFVYALFLYLRFVDYNMLNAPLAARLHLAWMYTLKFANLGPPVICGMFLSLRFLKNYHLKQEEKIKLVAENTNSQLGLLKAQIHPHFLFNTLSNIHSFALTDPSVATGLVSRLSDTLHYMIYDCESPAVFLDKELSLLKDYISIEKVRYSQRLNIRFSVHGEVSDQKIAPLFLIPLVENAFKHGTSQVLDNPWIAIDFHVSGTEVRMKISNSVNVSLRQPELAGGTDETILPADQYLQSGNGNDAENHVNFKSGIGLRNVRKRLSLLYADKHRLQIESGRDFYCAEISLPVIQSI